MDKEKILIIDGHSLLFQMYYGMPRKFKNKNGDYIEGVVGFLGGLKKIIKMVNPKYLHIVFDSEDNGIRSNVDQNYKANRKDYTNAPADDNPFFQLPMIYDCLNHLKVSFEEVSGCEADDMIGTIAKKYSTKHKVVISSQDSDLFQLIDDNTSILRYRGIKSVLFDQNHFNNTFSFSPTYYLTYKALVGDLSDNIKGVKGIGPKTAQRLINDYGDYRSILSGCQVKPEERISKMVNSNIDIIQKNIELINLLDVSIEEFILEKGIIKFDDFNTNSILNHLKIGF